MLVRLFKAHPSSLFQIRRFVREQGEQSSLSESVVADLVLATSEAGANAVLHTASAWIRVAWMCDGAMAEIRVQDEGVFHRAAGRTNHGRGLALISALVDVVAIREGTPARPGTMVRMVKRLAPTRVTGAAERAG